MSKFDLASKRAVGDIESKDVQEIAEFLNSLLANEYALFTKTLNYHWNVTGPRFHSLHTFLEDQYKQQLEIMDDMAERVRVLGENPIGTVKEMKDFMEMNEKNGKTLSSSEMIYDLFTSNLHIQSSIKDFVSDTDVFKKDPGTEDFLVSILQKHEMMSWMLKSHLT
ncbi:MAG: DNA starvation/stationary phase protection protein [Bacteriovoracaceae bacterium]|jgi:starvation-inducible DNA-binding protein|nr:DNA starvation/stationary phase protection protein [Bacteriovoracaceae bacterium]